MSSKTLIETKRRENCEAAASASYCTAHSNLVSKKAASNSNLERKQYQWKTGNLASKMANESGMKEMIVAERNHVKKKSKIKIIYQKTSIEEK
jgi:hypothetical protein